MKKTFGLLTAFSLVALILVLNGCKKTDKISASDQTVTDQIKMKLKSQSFKTTQILNLPGKGYYGDENGNMWVRKNMTDQRTDYYDCPDPSDDYFSQQVYSETSELTCTIGYRVEVKYDVSVLYNLSLTNLAGTLHSYGRLRLKNSSGTVIWPTGTAPKYNVTDIQDLGPDPSDNTLERFRVTFITDYIPQSTYDASTHAEPSLFVYTDCSNVPSINIGYSSQQATSTTANYTQPCRRVDQVYYNPSDGSTPNNIAGCNAAPPSCLPYGYVLPDHQEIQYYNGSAWVPFHLYWYGPTYNTSGVIDSYAIWFIDTGYTPTGTYQVRYRNVENNTSYGGPCSSDIWIYTNWTLL